MFAFRILPIVCALALSAAAAVAQEAPVTPPAAAAAPKMPHDCTKPMARHDHGAERGTPTAMPAACHKDAATSAKTKGKARGHDHSRVHKLM